MTSFPFSFPLCSICDLLILYCFFPEASLTVYPENDFGPGRGDDQSRYIFHFILDADRAEWTGKTSLIFPNMISSTVIVYRRTGLE